MPSCRSKRSAVAVGAAAALLTLMVGVSARGESAKTPGRGEIVLTIPEDTIQLLLDRSSPITGKTPQGLRYSVARPRVHIREGRILTTMAITLSGGIDILGIGLSLTGSLDAEIVARVDTRTRSIKGGFQIRRLQIDGLEELSNAEELKAFLNDNLTRFDYPIDIPPTEVPELSALLSGELLGLEVGDGKVLLRARLDAVRTRRD